jgi:hypothetical protein
MTSQPVIYVAAAGGASPWRPVPVSIAISGTILPSSTPRKRTVLGRAETVLDAGDSGAVDDTNAVVVRLQHAKDWLSNADEGALAAGTNLASLGPELLQFGKAEPLGDGRFRLSQLLRGRRGTEWATSIHQADETFCLLEEHALLPVELPRTSLEREVVATAHGLRDGDGKSSARLIVHGESMRAPAPVDLKAEPTATGDLMVSWRGRTFHDLESESLIAGGSLARDRKYMVVVRGAEDSISLQVATETTEIPGNLLQAFRGEELVVEVADVSGLIPSKACSVVIDW